MKQRGRAVGMVGATAALLIGCGAVLGLDPLGYDEEKDAAAADAGPGADARVDGAASEGGATDATGATDAGADVAAPRRCSLDAPFGPVTALDDLNSATLDGQARLTADELEVFFVSARLATHPADWGLWTARRRTPTDPFGAPRMVPAVNTMQLESDPSPTPNGNALYFMSQRGGLDYRLFRARREGDGFDAPVPLSVGHAADTNDIVPVVSPDGRWLYFSSNRPGGKGDHDIYRASIGVEGMGTPERLPDLNSAGADYVGAFSTDMLAVYLSSSRPGGEGDVDIWLATREATTSPFGPPRLVRELSTPNTELATWLSPDRCRLYLHRSSAPGAAGLAGTDLFVATRAP